MIANLILFIYSCIYFLKVGCPIEKKVKAQILFTYTFYYFQYKVTEMEFYIMYICITLASFPTCICIFAEVFTYHTYNTLMHTCFSLLIKSHLHQTKANNLYYHFIFIKLIIETSQYKWKMYCRNTLLPVYILSE